MSSPCSRDGRFESGYYTSLGPAEVAERTSAASVGRPHLVSRVANAENNRTERRRLGPLSGGLGRNWNEHRMRFISHKTTDQILDNLTGYLNRISNLGH